MVLEDVLLSALRNVYILFQEQGKVFHFIFQLSPASEERTYRKQKCFLRQTPVKFIQQDCIEVMHLI